MREELFAAGGGVTDYTEQTESHSFAKVVFPHETYEIEQVISTSCDIPLMFARHKLTKERVLLGTDEIYESKRIKTSKPFFPLKVGAIPSVDSVSAVHGGGYDFVLHHKDGTLWEAPTSLKQFEMIDDDKFTMVAHGYYHLIAYSKESNTLLKYKIDSTGEPTHMDPIPASETVVKLYGGAYHFVVETRSSRGAQQLYINGDVQKQKEFSVNAEMTEKSICLIDPKMYDHQRVVSVHLDWQVILFVTDQQVIMYVSQKRKHVTGIPTTETPRVYTCHSQVVYLWYQNLGEIWAIGQNYSGQLGLGNRDPIKEFTKILDLQAPNSLSKLPLKEIAVHYDTIILWFKDSNSALFLDNPRAATLNPSTRQQVSFGDVRFIW